MTCGNWTRTVGAGMLGHSDRSGLDERDRLDRREQSAHDIHRGDRQVMAKAGPPGNRRALPGRRRDRRGPSFSGTSRPRSWTGTRRRARPSPRRRTSSSCAGGGSALWDRVRRRGRSRRSCLGSLLGAVRKASGPEERAPDGGRDERQLVRVPLAPSVAAAPAFTASAASMRCPSTSASAFLARQGTGATEPITILTSRATPPSSRYTTAASARGQSNVCLCLTFR